MSDDEELQRLRKENDTLRALLGNSALPCTYCGLPAEDQAKCPHGFPGCSRADDQMLSRHFADGYRADEAEKRLNWVYQNIKVTPLTNSAYTRIVGSYVPGRHESIEKVIEAAVNPVSDTDFP